MPTAKKTHDNGPGQHPQMPTTQALVPFHAQHTTSHPGHPIAETMIEPSQEPYPEILRRSQQDAHQYHTAGEIMDRIADRVWVFQNYHVVEIDHEGYQPRINQDASWQHIRGWLHHQGGVEWMLSGQGSWPSHFERHLTYLALTI
jgi:hypothetical protein